MADEQGKVEEQQVEAKVEAPPTIDSMVADPTPEELAPVDDAATGEVQPSDDPAAPAVQETVEPNADAGGKAAEAAVVDEDEEIHPPTKREDGKWTDGKYVGDTLEDLFVQVKKAQRAAEKRVGKKREELLEEDPFLVAEEDLDDEFDIVDDVDFGQQVGAGVISALQQAGLAPQQHYDPSIAQAQALQIAQSAIDNHGTTDEEFRAVLAALIQANPMDDRSRQVVLDEWAARRPAAAAQEAANIQIGFAQFQQAQAMEQQQQAYLQQQEQVSAQQQELQQAQAEFRFGQETFVQQHPDWEQRNAGMNEWLQQNQWLMDSAKQQPLIGEGGRRTRAEAVRNVLKMAYDASAPEPTAATGVAGESGGASEHGGNMGVVTDPAHTDPAAARSGLAAEQRGLAALETGAAVDDVSVSVANPNPPGLDQHSFTDLTGIPTVPA